MDKDHHKYFSVQGKFFSPANSSGGIGFLEGDLVRHDTNEYMKESIK